MAGKIRNLLGRLFGKKPTPPTIPQPTQQRATGNRGIAARDLKNPDLRSYQERIARGQENIIKEDEAEDFLAGGNMIFVHSSNVAGAQYYPDTEQLMIEYKDGKSYLYDQINEALARRFLTMPSKGDFVWTYLRVRGTKNGHRVPYRKIG